MSDTLATHPPELEGASNEALPSHFEVRGVLGQGGMGVVLEAHDRRLRRDVAIKVLAGDVDDRRRFVREARAAAVLRDPSIVTLYEMSPAARYIVMELVRGETLRQRLAREGRLPAREVRRVGAALCRALGVAHAAGVVHRDVKPSNVLLDEAGAVRLTDFGVAAFGDSDLTAEGSIIGTPAYMAPEQARCATVDGRADVYSLGATLFEATTGRKLHQRDGRCADPGAAVRAATGDRRLARAIARAVAERRDDRPANAAALAAELAAAPGRAPAMAHAAAALALFAVMALVGRAVRPGVGAAAPRPLAVAVLPLEVTAADRSLDFASTGVARMVSRELAALRVEVVGQTRLLDNLASAPGDAHATAVALGAGLVVDGRLADHPDGGLVVRLRLRDARGRDRGAIERRVPDVETLPAALRLVAADLASAAWGRTVAPEGRAGVAFDAERELELGLREMRADRFSEASGHFRVALAAAPDLAEAHYQLAIAAWWAWPEPGRALAQIDRALAADLAPAQRDFLRAFRLLVGNRFPDAIDAFLALVDRSPDDVDVLYGAPDQIDALYGAFEALFHGGRHEEAVELFRRIRAHSPRYRLGLMHCLTFALTHPERAGDTAWMLEGLDGDAGHQLWLVRALAARRDVGGAMRLLDRIDSGVAGAGDPGAAGAIALERVRLLLAAGEVTQAAAHAERLDGEREATGWVVALAQGDAAEAHRWRAAALDAATSATAYARFERLITLATIQAGAGDAADAAEVLRDLAALEPEYQRFASVALLRVLLARAAGDDGAVAAGADSPFPEVRAAAEASLAERAGRRAEARAAWDRVADASGEGRAVPIARAAAAALARDDRDHAAVLAACDDVLRPRVWSGAWAGVVGPCRLWSAEAAAALGRRAEAREHLGRVLAARRKAPRGDALVTAALQAIEQVEAP